MDDHLADLAAFAAVAEERSFTRAASRMGVSTSALSHRMSKLERRLGLQLLARTTRSVAATAAGASLLEELRPSLERIERSLARARQQRGRTAGRLRLVLSGTAAEMVLMPRLAGFHRNYPEIVLEVTILNDPVDLIAGGFDAGIDIGEYVQREMIAVRVTPDFRLATFGSPEYFGTHPVPKTPLELKDHPCIGFRFRSGVYRWEFQKGQRQVTVNPLGPVSFDAPEFVVEAVLAGMGIGTALEPMVRPLIEAGRLIQVLEDWCEPFPGFHLYYPSRRHQPAALAALVQALRMERGTKRGLAASAPGCPAGK